MLYKQNRSPLYCEYFVRPNQRTKWRSKSPKTKKTKKRHFIYKSEAQSSRFKIQCYSNEVCSRNKLWSLPSLEETKARERLDSSSPIPFRLAYILYDSRIAWVACMYFTFMFILYESCEYLNLLKILLLIITTLLLYQWGLTSNH